MVGANTMATFSIFILVFGIVELLDRFDGILQQDRFPVLEVIFGPVSVSLSDIDNTIFAQFVQDPLDRVITDIVTVDKECDVVFVSHSLFFFLFRGIIAYSGVDWFSSLANLWFYCFFLSASPICSKTILQCFIRRNPGLLSIISHSAAGN